MPKIYLDVRCKCPDNFLFYVPHLLNPITAKKFRKDFPSFAELMDGESKENTLLFYWKYNKQENVYEFIDEESEDEVAELLGVKIYEGGDEDEDENPENRALTSEEVQQFRESLKEFHEGMKEWNERNEEEEKGKKGEKGQTE